MSSTPWSKASFITKKGRLRLVVQTEKLRSRDPRATTTYISFFPLSLLTLSKTEMWKKCRLEKAFNLPGLPYTKAKLIFIEGKKGNIFFDDIGIEVIRCSGCPTKGHFTAKSGKNGLRGFSKNIFSFFSPMKISLAFIWGTIYFSTMDGFFSILEKTSSEI